MRRPPSFRATLLATYLGLVVAVEVITILVLDRSLAADLVARLDERMETQARGVAAWVETRGEQHGERGGERSADRQAGRLAHVVGAHVTIVDGRGEVAGDSRRFSSDDPTLAEGEGRSPEILEARTQGVGRAIRSTRTGEELLYLAVPSPGQRGVVVRLAVPTAEVHAPIRAMRVRLAAASVAAFLVAVALGLFAARAIARPLRVMTETAARMAAGDYRAAGAVAPASGSAASASLGGVAGSTSAANDELGTLSRALGELAAQLDARIGELTHERDRLSAILEGMVEGVLVLSSEGRVILANASAAQITGSGGGDATTGVGGGPLAGRRITELAGSAALGVALTRVAERQVAETLALDVGEPGRERALVVNARPLARAAGGGIVAVLHDVTQERRVERMRRDFVANVSHELRTPIAAIQGYAETLSGAGIDPETRAEFLEIIRRHAGRLARMVEDLLALAELDARPPEAARREVVGLEDVAAAVKETARDRLLSRGIALHLAVEPGAIARGDPAGIEQVIDNLVDNAIKYGNPGGNITLGVRRVGPAEVVITVEDDGPGVAPEHLSRLFERFYRVDPARSRQVGGAGLGLAIVKRLVDSMGGAIAVESEVGRGTRFVVTLPA